MKKRLWKVLLMMALLSNTACSSSPKNIGLENGKLKPCPDSPNCVSSETDGTDTHAIPPLTYSDGLEAAKERLRSVINAFPRTRFVREDPSYWHVEFKSLVFRFVDDVEFHFANKLIHIRSASRVGHSDLGANRKRMERIRKKFGEGGKP